MAGRDKLKELKSNTQLWVWTRQWATQTTNKVELKVQRWCWATSLPGWAPPPSVWLSELGSVLFTFFSKVNLLPTFLIPSQCLAPPPLSLFQWIFILFLSTDSCTFFWWKKKKTKTCIHWRNNLHSSTTIFSELTRWHPLLFVLSLNFFIALSQLVEFSYIPSNSLVTHLLEIWFAMRSRPSPSQFYSKLLPQRLLVSF